MQDAPTTQTTKQHAMARAQQLLQNRTNWESAWADISNNILPTKGRFSGDTVNKAKSNATTVVDGTATGALDTLASSIHSGMTSPAHNWFRLSTRNKNISDSSAVKEWLGAVQEIMYDALASSNFYSAIHTLYTEEAAFGTGCIFVEESNDNDFVFKVITTGTYAIGIGDDGRADSIYRTFWMSARNIVSKWGKDRASIATQNMLTTSPDRFVEVCHIIYPRDNRDESKKDNLNMPFASLYWEKGSRDEDFLSESGFNEFPVMCPRWDVTAEDVYGQGPGLKALPDVKMLQQKATAHIMALHKMVTPPMAKGAGHKGRLNLLPGGENVVNVTGQDVSIKPLYEVRWDIQAISNDIERLQARIRSWFFNDLFLMLNQTPNMTATEVTERHEEKLLLLGPVIERQQYELLDPLIDRVFNILFRKGKLPDPPQELQGQELKVDYISILAQAQKMLKLGTIDRLVQFVMGVAQIAPNVLDRFDPDAAIIEYANIIGAPVEIVRSDDEVADIRAARAQQIQLQAQQQAEMAQAQTAKTMSQASLEGNNALNAGTQGGTQ